MRYTTIMNADISAKEFTIQCVQLSPLMAKLNCHVVWLQAQSHYCDGQQIIASHCKHPDTTKKVVVDEIL